MKSKDLEKKEKPVETKHAQEIRVKRELEKAVKACNHLYRTIHFTTRASKDLETAREAIGNALLIIEEMENE